MARNGSGNYTKVNTFTAGTPITAASHNQNWDDVAAEITNSVAADGQTTMTGPLKAASGTAAAPGLAFGSDPDTGTYRRGSNELGFAVGGVAAGYFDSAKKFYALGALDVTGAFTVGGVAKFPIVTADITDAAVTYAKIQDVSATSRILGRKTASAGDVEECTLSEILDFIGSAAQGDILYRSSASWARLPAGTSGQVLQTLGASANPQWVTPGLIKISTQTASSSASVAFTSGIDATYREYVFAIDNLLPATNDVQLQMQVSDDGGSSWKSTGYLATTVSCDSSGTTATNQTTASIGMSNQQSTGASLYNGSGGGWSGKASLFNPSSTTTRKHVTLHGSYVRATTGSLGMNVQGNGFWNGGNAAINAVRFIMSSGNVASGTITMYGAF